MSARIYIIAAWLCLAIAICFLPFLFFVGVALGYCFGFVGGVVFTAMCISAEPEHDHEGLKP